MSTDSFALHVPATTLEWYPEGRHCDHLESGDFLCVRGTTAFSTAIADGEKAAALREKALAPFVWCDHIAYVYEGGPDAVISQMGKHGHERVPASTYQAALYVRVHLPSLVVAQLMMMSAFDEACEGIDYGWEEFLPLIVDDLTGAKIEGSWGDRIVCSVHGTYLWMLGGLIPDRQPGAVIPARFAMWAGATSQPPTSSLSAR